MPPLCFISTAIYVHYLFITHTFSKSHGVQYSIRAHGIPDTNISMIHEKMNHFMTKMRFHTGDKD